MDDESDPIISERTVMLSRKLHDHLVLLQYPVRSAERTYDRVQVLATRVKPEQQSVEMELALDTKSCHYSTTGARDTGCMDRQVCRLTGTFIPTYFCSQEQSSIHGTFVTWYFHSLELSFPGTFAPLSENEVELLLFTQS